MENKKLNLNSFGTKFQSKNEVYLFLTTEVNMYLPPQKECSIYFVRNILAGTKRVRDYMIIINIIRLFTMTKLK